MKLHYKVLLFLEQKIDIEEFKYFREDNVIIYKDFIFDSFFSFFKYLNISDKYDTFINIFNRLPFESERRNKLIYNYVIEHELLYLNFDKRGYVTSVFEYIDDILDIKIYPRQKIAKFRNYANQFVGFTAYYVNKGHKKETTTYIPYNLFFVFRPSKIPRATIASLNYALNSKENNILLFHNLKFLRYYLMARGQDKELNILYKKIKFDVKFISQKTDYLYWLFAYNTKVFDKPILEYMASRPYNMFYYKKILKRLLKFRKKSYLTDFEKQNINKAIKEIKKIIQDRATYAVDEKTVYEYAKEVVLDNVDIVLKGKQYYAIIDKIYYRFNNLSELHRIVYRELAQYLRYAGIAKKYKRKIIALLFASKAEFYNYVMPYNEEIKFLFNNYSVFVLKENRITRVYETGINLHKKINTVNKVKYFSKGKYEQIEHLFYLIDKSLSNKKLFLYIVRKIAIALTFGYELNLCVSNKETKIFIEEVIKKLNIIKGPVNIRVNYSSIHLDCDFNYYVFKYIKYMKEKKSHYVLRKAIIELLSLVEPNDTPKTISNKLKNTKFYKTIMSL